MAYTTQYTGYSAHMTRSRPKSHVGVNTRSLAETRPPSRNGSDKARVFHRKLGESNNSAGQPPFDMMTLFRTPTCISYTTVANGIRYLVPKGLRTFYVVTQRQWVNAVDKWHERVVGVDEDEAVPGVTRAAIEYLLKKHMIGKDAHGYYGGRATPGWYLVQFLNLGFVTRADVLDTLVLHDADQMILPSFEVYGKGTFLHDGVERPRMRVRVGGSVIHSYDHSHMCLTGEKMAYTGNARKIAAAYKNQDITPNHSQYYVLPHTVTGSFVTHTFTAFKPYMQRLLSRFNPQALSSNFTTRVPAATGSPHFAPWLESAIRCINREDPKLGFGEIASYQTYLLSHHHDSIELASVKTWSRNPKGKSEWSMLKDGAGYCCKVQPLLERYSRINQEFLGTELGHDWSQKYNCKYTKDDFFLSSSYPPAKALFWVERKCILS